MKKVFFILIAFVLFFKATYSSTIEDTKHLFQDSTDKYFSPIDKQIENYLSNLERSKNHCFWQDKKQNFVQCINDIEKNFDSYTLKYKETCPKIISDTMQKSDGNYIPSLEAQKFLYSRNNDIFCARLYEFKIRIYRETAYDILKINKKQILQDENKLFTQNQRDRYSGLLDLIRTNIWYIERIWKKWPSKTQK